MFNEIQTSIYEEAVSFIFDKLDLIYQKSYKNHSSLIAFFVMTELLNDYDLPSVEKMAATFYSDNKKILAVFTELHSILHSNAPNHPFITSITDSRFSSEPTEDLIIEFSTKLRQELKGWSQTKFANSDLTTAEVVSVLVRNEENLSKISTEEIEQLESPEQISSLRA